VQLCGPPGHDGEVSVSAPLKASLLEAVALTPDGHGTPGATKLNWPVSGSMGPVNVFPDTVTLIDVPLCTMLQLEGAPDWEYTVHVPVRSTLAAAERTYAVRSTSRNVRRGNDMALLPLAASKIGLQGSHTAAGAGRSTTKAAGLGEHLVTLYAIWWNARTSAAMLPWARGWMPSLRPPAPRSRAPRR
jgi:hypothetical protein